MQSETAIEDQIDKAREKPDAYPDMSYSQGVEDALMWAIGDATVPPMED